MTEDKLVERIITRQFFIYLAGPVIGLSHDVATTWYDEVDRAFPPHLVPMKPLRGKTWLHGKTSINPEYAELHSLSTSDGIMTRAEHDVMRCDALLVNLLTAPIVPSLGTVMEIAWGRAYRKQIIVAMTKDNIHYRHPMIREACSIILPTLEEAIDVTRRLVSPI